MVGRVEHVGSVETMFPQSVHGQLDDWLGPLPFTQPMVDLGHVSSGWHADAEDPSREVLERQEYHQRDEQPGSGSWAGSTEQCGGPIGPPPPPRAGDTHGGAR